MYTPEGNLRPKAPKIDKLNLPIVGFISGLVFYILAIIALYYIRNRYNPSLSNLWKTLSVTDNPYFSAEASKLLSLGLIGLLIPFWWHLNKNRYFATRGVLLIAMIGAVFIFMYNFIW